MLLSYSSAGAQVGVNSAHSQIFETQSSRIDSVLIEPDGQNPKRELPDAPIPILPNRQDGPMPCPAGIGRPCALLGGRLYFNDPSHMTEHDKSWVQAAKNPMILAGIGINLAGDIWDYKATRGCISRHVCREANPLMGQSRAQQVSVSAALNVTLYFLAVQLKQRGEGNYAFAVLVGGALMHVYFASSARSVK